MREDGRMVGGEEWQEKVYDREEWKRLLRTARNHRILYMPMGWIGLDPFLYSTQKRYFQLNMYNPTHNEISLTVYNVHLYYDHTLYS